MTGAPDAVYIQARRVLLDALEALGEHRSALVLVGAQAIYLRTGEGGLAVAPYTIDGDIAVDPEKLSSAPKLEDTMTAAGFVLSAQPGVWIGTGSVEIDLLVPESLGGGGRRGARLGEHGNRAARKARGLEAALVDNTSLEIAALAPDDARRFEVAVAGPAFPPRCQTSQTCRSRGGRWAPRGQGRPRHPATPPRHWNRRTVDRTEQACRRSTLCRSHDRGHRSPAGALRQCQRAGVPDGRSSSSAS